MTPDRIPAALFVSAILSCRRDLDARTRLSIIARVPAFDMKSPEEAINGLAEAFRAACIPIPNRSLSSRRMAAATVSAEDWLNKKIFVISREDFGSQSRDEQHIPELMYAFGDASIASSRAAAILNSRQPKRVSPNDFWINATRNLVRDAERAKLTIVSSYGTIPYCMVSRFAFGSPMIVVCDDVLPFMIPSRSDDFFFKYGDLFRFDSTLFISPFPPGWNLPKETRLVERDRLVADLASVLLVAEIRSGGNMAKVVADAADRRKEIVKYSANAECTGFAAQSDMDEKPLHIDVPLFSEMERNANYLIHYTRSCPGPWPGQTVADFCLSLINGCERSAHSGFDTLLRILSESLIRGSSRLTRHAHCVVSLTECSPEEILTLTKWRRGLIRWSFEPYGIGLPREDLFQMGARPVIYAVADAFQDLSPDLEHLFQLQGKKTTDWSAEREWRVRGDLVLSKDLQEKMLVIVPSQEKALIVQREFGCFTALAIASGRYERNAQNSRTVRRLSDD